MIPPQGEGLDRSLGMNPLAIDGARRIEALDLEIVHFVVKVEGRWMADPTLPLPEEDVLAQALLFRGLGGIEDAEDCQFRRRGKIEHFLHLGHHDHLAVPIREIGPFFGGDDVVVAYLAPADNVSRLLPIPLRRVNQPVSALETCF